MDHIVQMGPGSDPYFEEIPEDELHFYQRKGARRKRRMPTIIPPKDAKILESVKRKAYRLDLLLSFCGLRLGWAGIIGLLPWVGDIIACSLALQLLKKAEGIEGGLPAKLRLQMMVNIMFDFGIGLIPLVGDFINVLYKCNSRNFVLLEKHLVEKYSKGTHAAVQPADKEHDPQKPPKAHGAVSGNGAKGGGLPLINDNGHMV